MILSLNPGSSSLKYKLFSFNLELIKENDFSITKDFDFTDAIKKMLIEVGQDIESISKIGVRVVHGGSKYHRPTVVDKSVLSYLEDISYLAPLHNPPAVKLIKALLKQVKIPVYIVCDTAFFRDLPAWSNRYAIPRVITEKYGLYRYGFHGISHRFALESIENNNNKRVISIHLGAGCSACAILNGKPIDISMGTTPNEGLIMQTRSGDLSPAVALILVEKLGLKKAKEVIEKNSGLAGLSGTSGAMLEVLYSANEKIEHDEVNFSFTKDKDSASLALDMYINRIKKYIGAYSALMDGVDSIIFTGKIAYRSSYLRDRILNGLDYLNIKEVKVVMPDEELAIATELTELK